MADNETITAKKPGRPKKVSVANATPLNEQQTDVLAMSQTQESQSQSQEPEKVTVEDLNAKWTHVIQQFSNGVHIMNPVPDKWNQLNPFLQNQRLKNLYTHAQKYSKADISSFLENPGNSEVQLRGLSWANSSSQQIYYNVLRRACDIPLYNYYVIPDLLDSDAKYNDKQFKAEDGFVHDWLEEFRVKPTLKTIALEVKREGKSSYLLRNKYVGLGTNKQVSFCTLQKLPTDWIKITGKGSLGYTISFNMMYFLNMANSPDQYGEFIKAAWDDMLAHDIVHLSPDGKKYEFSLENCVKTKEGEKPEFYSFKYGGITYNPTIESITQRRQISYMFWLKMPFDICYTFASDNSHPWMAPDTMGLMLKMQELTDYMQLAGLIASTPLTAVLTGEIEPVAGARPLKSESIFSPEVIKGMQDKFNALTSTNVEAFMWPAKNIKLQQLSTDVNSSEIISTATANFLESAGEGGLTIATDKPNVAQVNVAKYLAASQQNYVTLQFESVLNYIIQHKLGLEYKWKIKLWGDIFTILDEKKYLKEIVANGNVALFPKLMSAEGISVRDSAAIVKYITQLDFYKHFTTYTQIQNANLKEQQENDAEKRKGAGRPTISDDDVDNDATAASKASGANTSDNRE